MEYKVSNKANITTILLIVIGLAAFLIGLFTSHGHTGQRVWANLLVNGYFFFTISLASLFFVALQYISEMAWGVTTQRVFQATMSFMPVSALVLLVVFIGGSMHWNHLYHWMAEGITDPKSEHYDAIITAKSGYLNLPFFWGRTIAYFAVWLFFAYWFVKKSKEEDQLTLAKGETSPVYKKKIFMGVLFVAFFAYTSSSSAWDWLMSIDVHWFSTMFGWYAFSGMWVSSIIVVLLLVLYLKSLGHLKEVNDSHIHDLGKWMFAISMLWSYLWFSQFMLIWYSNIPEEVTYYMERFNDYKLLYVGTFFVNFLLPFFVLMSRDAKKNVVFLLPVALIIFFTHWLDVLTMVLPGTMHNHGSLGSIEIGMFLMFLGLFIMVTLRSLSKTPLMAKNHPMYDESIHLHT
jgi:uncharacterized membrane protein YiaA